MSAGWMLKLTEDASGKPPECSARTRSAMREAPHRGGAVAAWRRSRARRGSMFTHSPMEASRRCVWSATANARREFEGLHDLVAEVSRRPQRHDRKAGSGRWASQRRSPACRRKTRTFLSTDENAPVASGHDYGPHRPSGNFPGLRAKNSSSEPPSLRVARAVGRIGLSARAGGGHPCTWL